MKVQIINWKKFNEKRKDVKKPTWLRLEHDLPQSPSLFGMDPIARYVFISLLCLANKRQTNELEFELNWFCHFSGSCFSETELNAALERLNGKCVRIRDEDVTCTSRGRDANVSLRDETDGRDVTRRDETGSREKNLAAPSAPVWESYSVAFATKYGEPPPRNAKANALCLQLVKRLGGEEAPEVARFYVGLNGFYASRGHPLSLLVNDAEKLRTEWKTGNKIAPQSSAQNNMENLKAMYRKVEEGKL